MLEWQLTDTCLRFTFSRMLEPCTIHRVEVPKGYVAVRTTGTGPDVVLVHGIPGSGRAWDLVAARLAGHHRVVVPDLLGFGQSARPRGDGLWAEAQSDALALALDELGVERAAIVGHDFGGPVALKLVGARPDLATHLVLASTNAFPDTPIPFPVENPSIARPAPVLVILSTAFGGFTSDDPAKGSPRPAACHVPSPLASLVSTRPAAAPADMRKPVTRTVPTTSSGTVGVVVPIPLAP